MKGCEGQLPTVQDEGMRLTKGDDGDGVQSRNRGRKDVAPTQWQSTHGEGDLVGSEVCERRDRGGRRMNQRSEEYAQLALTETQYLQTKGEEQREKIHE